MVDRWRRSAWLEGLVTTAGGRNGPLYMDMVPPGPAGSVARSDCME